MKRFNVSVPKKYIKDGEEKTAWKNVGTLVYFPKTDTKPAGFTLELNMFPDTKFGIFADEPREQKQDTISKDDIPFD